MGSSREEFERATKSLDDVASKWSITVSLPKTKFLFAGTWNESDMQSVIIRGESIEAVTDFKYLISVVEAHGEDMKDEKDKIARASRDFGVLCRPFFQDGSLSLKTKWKVYHAVVLGVLLHGAEAWVNKRATTRKVEFFNNMCLRCILGITNA